MFTIIDYPMVSIHIFIEDRTLLFRINLTLLESERLYK